MKSIMDRIDDHYAESRKYFKQDEIVGIFLQGSQNYGLDLPGSDVDTKLIVLPSFKDIALANKPVSTTHIRANEEHTDWKDIRLYMETFRKQNLNFLEILFTDFKFVNPKYEAQWNRLITERERIARMNPYQAVKSMKGIAMEKYHAMEHRYPSKVEILDRMGYDPKQLHHLARVDDFQTRYINGEKYDDCLHPVPAIRKLLLDIKRGMFPLDEARDMADMYIDHVTKISDSFCAERVDAEDPAMKALLEDVSYNIMKIAVQEELKNL